MSSNWREEHTAKVAEIESFISTLNLAYTATFVPFSLSRNAKQVRQLSDLTINWKIALASMTSNRVVLETDYSQGVAYLPGYKRDMGRYQSDMDTCRHMCETGKVYRFGKIGRAHV